MSKGELIANGIRAFLEILKRIGGKKKRKNIARRALEKVERRRHESRK